MTSRLQHLSARLTRQPTMAPVEVADGSATLNVKQFYANKCVLLTGCTGFLAKILLERLLSNCPDIKKVYVMVRPKRGMEPMQRVRKQILNSECFSALIRKFPSREAFLQYAESKIRPVTGDLLVDGLGLSKEDHQMIVDTVDVVINSAASVSFDDPI